MVASYATNRGPVQGVHGPMLAGKDSSPPKQDKCLNKTVGRIISTL